MNMKKLDITYMSSIIRKIVASYGVDMLDKEPQYRALLMDYMGNNMNSIEGHLLIISAEIGLGRIFYKVGENKNQWMGLVDSAYRLLINQYEFSKHRCEELILVYMSGIGLLNIENAAKEKQYIEQIDKWFNDVDKGIEDNPVIEMLTNDMEEKEIICKHSYGIRYIEDYDIYRDRKKTKIWNIIKKGDRLPIKKESISRKIFDGVTETTFFIYESDSKEKTYNPEEGSLIGMVKLSDIKDSKAGDETKLIMEMNKLGELNVEVVDIKSGLAESNIIQLR
ncbi:MAG: hypothetical protein K6E10_09625 [Eubacterium sp.]|nr:hypothetical protein [Eubacterium sp.]